MVYELYFNKDVKKKLLVSKQQHLICSWIYNLSRPPLGQLTYASLGISWGGSKAGAGIVWRLLHSFVWFGSWCWLLARTPAGVVSWNTYTLHVAWDTSLHGGWVPWASIPKREGTIKKLSFFLWPTSESHTLSLTKFCVLEESNWGQPVFKKRWIRLHLL